MLEINQGIVCDIIKKAREINISEDLVLPEERGDLSDTEWKQALAEYQDDLSYLELKDLINELEPDQQEDIIALMYIGRGDYTKNEWKAARQQAHTVKHASRADYLISKRMLADYLSEGLAALGYDACDE
jgi:hypothetical protein